MFGSYDVRIRFCQLAIATVAMVVSGLALAAAGTVTGTLRFYQAQGNYCDTPAGTPGDKNGAGNQTCDGFSLYQEAEFNTFVNVALTKVYVQDQSGVIIGSGGTDLAGNFTMSWNRTPAPTSIRLSWRFEDGLNVFRITTSAGAPWQAVSSWTAPCVGCTTNLGVQKVGSAGSPNGLANLYNGAQKMFYNALQYTHLASSFTNLEIRAWPTTCPSACADGPNNQILMPPPPDTSWRGPQARILHEMGHIANYKSKPRRTWHGSYCYPLQEVATGPTCSDGSSNAWSMTSSEWQGVALEEGRATFFGDVALYWHSAADPRTCNSTGACSTTGRLETTLACSGTMGRRAMQVARYLWDSYDVPSDGSETSQLSYHELVRVPSLTPSGYGSYDAESPFVNSGPTIDCWDCYSPWEWLVQILVIGQPFADTGEEFQQNCMDFF